MTAFWTDTKPAFAQNHETCEKEDESKLNVLIIAQYFPPDLGGSATRAYNVAKGLVLNGCNVTVVTAFPHYPEGKIPKKYRWKPLKVETDGEIRTIRTFVPPIRSVGFFRRLLLIGFFAMSSLFALPLVGKTDAIWASSWIPGIVYKKLERKPLALNEDDLTLEDTVDLGLINVDSFALKVAEKVYRLCLLQGDAITPISPAYVETLSKKYWVNRKKIHVVRGGVDLDVFKNRSRRSKTDKFIVLYSGAFSVAYDFDQVLRAAEIIEKRDSHVEFVLQGKDNLESHVKSRVKRMGLSNVCVIDRLLKRQEVADLLGKADVLILPLRDFGKPYLGISTKLYEYQAVGKPIVCCAHGQPAEYIEDTGSGIAVRPGDCQELAEVVMYLKNNVGEASEMGRRGRIYIEDHLTIETIGFEVKKILDEHLTIWPTFSGNGCKNRKVASWLD